MNVFKITATFTATIIYSIATCNAQPPVWQPLGNIPIKKPLRIIEVHPSFPSLLYAASESALYQSQDSGLSWRECFRSPGRALILALSIDPFDSTHVLAVTETGLYGSNDGAHAWRLLFKGGDASRPRCQTVAFHPSRPNQIALGTGSGLFLSTDNGQSWKKESPGPGNYTVLAIAITPNKPDYIYLLTDKGLFLYNMTNQECSQLLMAVSIDKVLDESSEEDIQEPIEDASYELQFTSLAIDPHDSNRIYVAGNKGLLLSTDGGSSWQQITRIGLGKKAVFHMILHSQSPTVLYAATDSGVARYHPEKEIWEFLYSGLPTQEIHYLSSSKSKVYVTTGQGLFALDLTKEQIEQGNIPDAQELLGNFLHEPTIAQVQAAAIKYADVEPKKIERWRRQARLKSLLPTFKIGFDRDEDTYLNAIGSTSNPAYDRIIRTKDPSSSFDLSVDWDLGDLIWSSDQTSIDVRSRLTVQLRDDVLDEATRAFFERRRIQLQLLTDPPKDYKTKLDKELRISELTAMLDGLTGGWFSKEADKNRSM